MAHSTRPQLASVPKTAHFTRGERTTALAICSACSSVSAPITVQVMSRPAPSPSLAIILASYSQTWRRAAKKMS